jgi:hypothetical protein
MGFTGFAFFVATLIVVRRSDATRKKEMEGQEIQKTRGA